VFVFSLEVDCVKMQKNSSQALQPSRKTVKHVVRNEVTVRKLCVDKVTAHSLTLTAWHPCDFSDVYLTQTFN